MWPGLPYGISMETVEGRVSTGRPGRVSGLVVGCGDVAARDTAVATPRRGEGGTPAESISELAVWPRKQRRIRGAVFHAG